MAHASGRKRSTGHRALTFFRQGAVLILAGIRSMIWYRFSGVSHWIVHLPMLGSGATLCLLGLLDLGQYEIGVSYTVEQGSMVTKGDAPITALLFDELPLVIVMLVYIWTYFATLILIGCVHRKKGGVYSNGEESKWIA